MDSRPSGACATPGTVWVDGTYHFSPLANGNYEVILIDGQFRTPTDRADCWVPPLNFENQCSLGKDQSEYRFAADGLKTVFSDGFRILPSEHIGMFGGFHAIAASFQAQHPEIKPPKVEELQVALREYHTSGNAEANGLTANETSHLLGMLLYEWGRRHGFSIALVYIVKDQGLFRIPCPASIQERLVVCIYGLDLPRAQRTKRQWYGLEPKPHLIRSLSKPSCENKASSNLKFSPKKVKSKIPRPPQKDLDQRSILHGPYYDQPHQTNPWIKGPYWIKWQPSSGVIEKILGPGARETKGLPKPVIASEPKVMSSKVTGKRKAGLSSHFGNLVIQSPCHNSDKWKQLGAIASETPMLQDTNIYVSDIELECVRLLEDISERRIPGSDNLMYHQAITQFGGVERYAKQLMEYVDPEIRNLREVWVTRALLDEVMSRQTSKYSKENGYLDYVTDDRLETYFRPYVGQTNNSRRRLLVDHANAIISGDHSTLHYFILWLGNGHRRANFVQLWSFGDCADESHRRASANILETLFTRVFQSDHGATNSSERSFGNGLGLNLLSPLLQTASLDQKVRVQMVTPSRASPDIQIGLWDAFRNSQKKRRTPTERPLWKDDDFRDALKVAIGSNECAEELWTAIDQSVWVSTASNNTLSQLQQTGMRIFGSLDAKVGVILDYATTDRRFFSNQVSEPDERLLPWILEKSGFDEANSLIWQYKFGVFQTLETMEANNFLDANPKDSYELNRWLIRSSAMKVILVCGNRAWAAIQNLAQRDPRQVHNSITLRCEYRYQFLISRDDGEVRARLYLNCPPIPISAHLNNLGSGVRTCELFKFVKSLTSIESIRPFFFESQAAFRYVLGLRRKENRGATKLNLTTLPVELQCWLSRKGFEEDDLRQLEDIAGDEGIIGGIHMVLLASSRSPTRRKYNLDLGPRRVDSAPIKPASEYQSHTYLPEKLERAMRLYNDVQDRLEDNFAQWGVSLAPAMSGETLSTISMVTAAGPHVDDIDLHHNDMKEIIEADTTSTATDDVEVVWDDDSLENSAADDDVLQTATQLYECQAKERPQRRLQRKKQSHIGDPVIQRLKAVHNWATQRNTSMLYSSTVGHYTSGSSRQIVICHLKLRLPTDIQTCEFQVQIEVANDGKRHPQAYAHDAKEYDPGCCLAFKIMAMNGQVVLREFYARTGGIRAVAKANAFADRLIHGLDYEDMLNSKRRYIHLPHSLKPQLSEQHHRFLGGGYTSDLDHLLNTNNRDSEGEAEPNI